ncbi:hypothetical protein COS66_00140 [Candidatus Berkelbacteria bacterium CG06_land_8_20_14_3_00_43_10]|uniref:Uncharacterized protein n=1 Tax=Candidatus Berkelbacteria bacterium CG10_big_fil_rev_8_21_14_0_10_43_14 TaxID=1974515 RepID=A0A2M6R8B0_9BACT|nr:MAG: hypothetical protein AUK41_02030 [Candidatus Berkelbacteria bacterium CG2_30_43_20]PIS06838.1 MAG: hypothetical protein COT79_02405 [Candidatus Berkelbacteria bacterium CG10_big_fil_rev_8_21_14_0_10_43_14]PIU87576.1 MAG: hypothetical protein COS66_00140 [Candidatus Berkelbacteria bacterium CG06_land_8_20_14_3_00_43_10]
MIKTIDVYCKNDHILFEKYRKVKSGLLLKCYIDEIRTDHCNVKTLHNSDYVMCPECSITIGIIGLVHGRPAVIINHGGTRKVRT